MTNGSVIEIFIAKTRGEQTFFVDQIHVIPGMGIEGDRYFKDPSNSTDKRDPGFQITLIQKEVIDSLREIDGIEITPRDTRRNIITQGIALNDLVDRVFFIGNIQLRGVRLCEPCTKLAGRTDPRVLNALTHRGGLRADILTEGVIHINDLITTGE